jgi:two-component system, NarL family, nitrate/nitrite response regulator NarL
MSVFPAAIRVVVAHQHPIFRSGLKLLLEERGVRVVAEAADGIQAIEYVQKLQPDVLLLDFAIPAGGLDMLRVLGAASRSVRPIVLTDRDDPALLTAVRLGARGIVSKQSPVMTLFESLQSVMRGEYWLVDDPVATEFEVTRRLRPRRTTATSNRYRLTRREMQIVAAVADGESNKGIAERLKVSEDTVKHHLSNIFDKLGVYSRLELAVFAINHGLIQEPDQEPHRQQATGS